MQTVSEINNYPEPKFRHFWRHLASAINRFLTASQFRYFSIATRFRNFWRHIASAIRRFLTAWQFRYFEIATRFRRLSRHLASEASRFSASINQARFLQVKVDGLKTDFS